MAFFCRWRPTRLGHGNISPTAIDHHQFTKRSFGMKSKGLPKRPTYELNRFCSLRQPTVLGGVTLVPQPRRCFARWMPVPSGTISILRFWPDDRYAQPEKAVNIATYDREQPLMMRKSQ